MSARSVVKDTQTHTLLGHNIKAELENRQMGANSLKYTIQMHREIRG